MTVLHVEDQPVIREVVRRALEPCGFTIVSVEGVGAAKLALAKRDDVTSALLDIRLRDGNGLDLYDWLRVHRPALALRVAFVTGSADAALEPLVAIGCPVLRKPFEIDDLRRLVGGWESVADAGER